MLDSLGTNSIASYSESCHTLDEFHDYSNVSSVSVNLARDRSLFVSGFELNQIIGALATFISLSVLLRIYLVGCRKPCIILATGPIGSSVHLHPTYYNVDSSYFAQG